MRTTHVPHSVVPVVAVALFVYGYPSTLRITTVGILAFLINNLITNTTKEADIALSSVQISQTSQRDLSWPALFLALLVR